jgi:hypothetical protein
MSLRLIDDFKASTHAAVLQTELAAAAVFAFLIAIAFLCAACFIIVREHYGPVEACLAGAGLFLVVALIVIGIYAARRRQIEARAAARAKSTAQTLLSDPALLAAGIQIVRMVGVKRLIPILAVGGLALGLMAGRSQANTAAGEQAPAE